MKWYTPSTISDDWDDAPANADLLGLYVAAARDQIERFSVELDDPEDITASYRLAHLIQTRNIWNANNGTDTSGYGDGEFVFRTPPLDWQVKALVVRRLEAT
ncbi:MAG: hypothetical protein ACTH9T_04845 [Mycetocola reblochoni]|uniref:hypothetical protein n=1 Tax=Mycetocola reblochoni TaxID=331618 RepID=UPI003F9D87F7